MLGLGLMALFNPLVDVATGDAHYLLTAVVAVVASVVGFRRLPRGRRRAWALLTTGLVVTVVGDLVWGVQDLRGEVPFPGPADVLYLVGLAAMVAGALLLLVHHQRASTLQTTVDAAIVAVAGSLLLWLVVGSGLLANGDAGGLSFAVGLAYPLLDIVLLGGLAAVALGRGLRTPAVGLLTASFGVVLVADVVYLVQETTSVYVSNTSLDSLWLLAYAGIAGSILHPSAGQDEPPAPDGPPTVNAAQMIGVGSLLGAVGVAIIVVGYDRITTDPETFLVDLLVTAPLGILMMGLLLTRVGMTTRALATIIRERDEAHRRELGLATVASMLALADDVTAVRAAVHEAGTIVGDPDATVRLHLPEAGDEPDAAGSEGPRVQLRLPLTPDPSDGALVVRAPHGVAPITRGALDRVVTDVVMALDRCRLVEELRASEQRFSSLVRNAPDAITVHDASGRLTYVSPALGRITGSDEGALLGRAWDSFFHPQGSTASPTARSLARTRSSPGSTPPGAR